MSDNFELNITTDSAQQSAEFRLLDAHGVQLGYKHTNLKSLSLSERQSLFDLRHYLNNYVEPDRQAASMAEVGVCIAEKVLGLAISSQLWASAAQRSARIVLQGAAEAHNPLAADMARVPWEIARPSASQPTLAERNLVLRLVHSAQSQASEPLHLGANEDLRVLFVFAESRGSRPLGARQERQALEQMLRQDIYPRRRVVAHFLTHGVTRERLKAQIEEHNGYHIVHWSGHGQHNQLELAQHGGAADTLSGQELLKLFHEAGGFVPRLMFLSACHSGAPVQIKNFADFAGFAQRGVAPGPDANAKDSSAEPAQLGFSGTAHALLQGGVPAVVAMRFAVGDDYARELALGFYRKLLADEQPKTPVVALQMARRSLASASGEPAALFAPCDHATPLLYGDGQARITPHPGRSPALQAQRRRLPSIAELSQAEHGNFVGRTWELAGLGAEVIGAARSTQIKPVAVITGLGGMGKTALLAEALALWEERFNWMLLFQAKPNPLSLEDMLRKIDMALRGELGRYHQHIQQHPADAVFREADEDFTGPERIKRLVANLVRALQDEPIGLVLDNFENNLKPQTEETSASACQDPAWDECLAQLAQALVGSPSRLLITSRRPIAALPATLARPLPLGPLPALEAELYLRAHPALRAMVVGSDEAESDLAQRLLQASRFHPLLMDRLAKLATAPALRPELLQALETLEARADFAQLPALFSAQRDDAREMAYLADALCASTDQLIAASRPNARRVLWVIALANEPVSLGLLEAVWQRVNPPAPSSAEPLPLQAPLAQLTAMGLVNQEGSDAQDTHHSCHELVRERTHVWMAGHPDHHGTLSAQNIRLAFVDQLEAVFKAQLHQNMSIALQAGSQALVYCVQAQSWERLGGFASTLVTGSNDPHLLERLLPHLHSAAALAPNGKPRWACLCYLADALRRSGRPDQSLRFYTQAADLARGAARAGSVGGEDARPAWRALGVILGNGANALVDIGQLGAARDWHMESAKADRQAGSPAIDILGSELEALRIDIMQGKVELAMPQIEQRLAQVTTWWQAQRRGQRVPEAQDAEILARAYFSALDVATQADLAADDWPSALLRLNTTLEAKKVLQRPAQEVAEIRMNRANVLQALGRNVEAQQELESCLETFHNNPVKAARTLGSLAKLFGEQNDWPQAIALARQALAKCEVSPDPLDRAISHSNLAVCLERVARAKAPALAEASSHQLASLIYFMLADQRQHLPTVLHNYAVRFHSAQTSGQAHYIPRLAQFLTDPAFAPLKHWLQERQVNIDELQAGIDELLEQARQAALDTPNP